MVPNSKICIFWLDLLDFDIFFVVMASVAMVKCSQMIFLLIFLDIFWISIGKSKILMCYGVTLEISYDPILSSNDDFRRKLWWLCQTYHQNVILMNSFWFTKHYDWRSGFRPNIFCSVPFWLEWPKYLMNSQFSIKSFSYQIILFFMSSFDIQP